MAANNLTLPTPASYVAFPHRQLGGALAPGAATANAVTIGEVVNIAFSRYLTIRFKCATAGGNLNFDFVRPVAAEPVFLTNGPINPAQVYKYTSPASPTTVAATAGTETSMQITCNGESYGYISFTGGGTGSIVYVDVSGL